MTTVVFMNKLIDEDKRKQTFLSDEDVMITIPMLDIFTFFCFLVKIHGQDSYHWVAARVTEKDIPSLYFFSSYGLDPSHNQYYDIRRYIDKNIELYCYKVETVSKFQPYIAFQDDGSPDCGFYAAAFINFNGDINQMIKEIDLVPVNEQKIWDENTVERKKAEENDKKIKDYFESYLLIVVKFLLSLFFC